MTNDKLNPITSGDDFSGIYTARNPIKKRSAKYGNYLLFQIQPRMIPTQVIAWENSCQGLTQLWHGQDIKLEGSWERFYGNWQVHCHAINHAPSQNSIVERSKIRLRALLSWIQDDVLKTFIKRVMSDESLRTAFLNAPASLKHHHAFKGGLLVHSVDVAWQVFSNQRTSQQERYVGTVAALFHDIGKTKTLTTGMGRTDLGKLVDHEQLTLEILAPHLTWLEAQDTSLAITLRYLLTWKPQGCHRIPKFAVHEVIKMADRVSAGSGELMNQNAINSRSFLGAE